MIGPRVIGSHAIAVRPAPMLLLLWMLAGCGNPSHAATPCTADRDCESGVCVAEPSSTPVDLDPLPLVCAPTRDAGVDAACCQREQDCARGICLVSGSCVVPCGDGTDCAASERCASVYARAGEAALQTLNACVSRVELAGDVRVTETLLSAVLTTNANGVGIDLPAINGTDVFVLEHRSEALWPLTVECRSPLCVEALATRDATPITLFDAATLVPGNIAPLNTVSTSVDNFLSTILLPNGPRSVLSNQGYRVTVRSESAGDLAITQIERSASTNQLGGPLALHLYYVGANGLRPEGTRGPMFVSDAIDRAEAILSPSGLSIGDVCQTDVVGALRDRLSVVDPPRFGLLVELPELLALSAGGRGSAIDVFLVDQVDVALGISGGLPGPPGMHGTGSSGVAMSVALFDDSVQFGRALAHELGHFLGLFHPVEADGVTLDPLADSPRDSSNLMSRSATGGESLTANQRNVLRSSPLLE